MKTKHLLFNVFKSILGLKYLTAFSIVETLVAMILVLISFSLGLFLFIQILSNEAITLNGRSMELVESQLQAVTQSPTEYIEEIQYADITVITELAHTQGDQTLVSVRAINGFGTTIQELKSYIHIDE